MVKNPSAKAVNTGDEGLIAESGRSPGGGNGNPLQYSCPENPMDRGAWGLRVYRVAKESNMTEQLSAHALIVKIRNINNPFLYQRTYTHPHTCNRGVSQIQESQSKSWVRHFLQSSCCRQGTQGKFCSDVHASPYYSILFSLILIGNGPKFGTSIFLLFTQSLLQGSPNGLGDALGLLGLTGSPGQIFRTVSPSLS